MADGMTDIHERWLEAQRRRWMLPNAERFIRPDAERFMRPDAERYMRPDADRFLPPWALERKRTTQPAGQTGDAISDWEFEAEVRRLAVSPTKQKGYNDHHIVEKDSAAKAKFPDSLINGPDNLVRIPTLKHWEITGWSMKENASPPFNGLSPRDYLEDKSWAERRAIGLRALIEHGVVKP